MTSIEDSPQVIKTEEESRLFEVIIVSTNKKGYPSYLAYESIAVGAFSLFCGFIFTAITILLTRFPDPSLMAAQVTLFFLTFLFEMLLFLIFFGIYYLSYCVTETPPEAKGRRIVALLYILMCNLWGVIIVPMYLLWNLYYLALASGAVYASFAVLAAIYIWKPMLKLLKEIRPEK
jgi:hypothetical protein